MRYFYLLSFLLIAYSTCIFAQAPQIVPAEHPGIAGLWEFENSLNLLEASYGNDLSLTGTQSQITGPTAEDDAIRIDVGSYLTCNHGINANGGGSDVNEYCLVFDFKISNNSEWHCFYQANSSNSNDGELFINTSGNIGRSTLGPGYSSYQVNQNEWYRMVVAVDLDNYYRVYLDGALILDGGALSIDGDYGIYAATEENLVHFFADNDGEDNEIDIALAAIFDHPLNQTEVNSLGGYGHEITPILTGILPYLQTPTPSSVYVSWHSNNTGSTTVEYGETDALGSTTNGSVEDISGKKWHTVQLTGLSPNTEYFYKCISESEESEVYTFKTPPSETENAEFLRFIIVGDSRTDAAKTTEIANTVKQQAIDLYGEDIHNQINMVINVGDIVTSGSVISQYENEYFKPYACLSANIPFMVIIGNHEAESQNFYDYMKYEDHSDFGFPLEERFYDFYYLDNHFVFINGNTSLQSGIQTSWLESVLEESNNIDEVEMVWCFTHQPGHSELWPDGNTEYIQNDVIPVLRQYDKVQLFAYGHSHNYERGTVESLASNSIGDFYIMLTGGAGSPLDRCGMYPNQTDYEEIMISLDHYIYNIVEIDLANSTMEVMTYSLGNSDKPLDNVLIDHYYRKLNQEKPETPVTLSPVDETGSQPLLVGSIYAGADSLMSSLFQITNIPGDYSSPIVQKRQDWTNVYGDTGAPDYEPIDLNEGIDLRRLQVEETIGDGTYYWRVRYRDHNQKWSEWSDEQEFTVNSSASNYTDFSANITTGEAPLTINFTDLSYPAASSWSWDFENDSDVDSDVQDPVFTYNFPGFYSVVLTTENGIETKDLYINVEDNTVEIVENKGNDILRVNPNPCIDKTNIEFYIKEKSHVKITVLDNTGKTIKILENSELGGGKHNITWNLTTDSGNTVSSGRYFIKMKYNSNSEVKKLIVQKK